jgi:hypothetical protein
MRTVKTHLLVALITRKAVWVNRSLQVEALSWPPTQRKIPVVKEKAILVVHKGWSKARHMMSIHAYLVQETKPSDQRDRTIERIFHIRWLPSNSI